MSLHEPNEYNEYLGQETIKCEYKEFTFNLAGLLDDNKLAEQYCTTNKFDFNKNVIFNLGKYFKAYIPKYACGYFNSGIDGSFYIGINNYGFVKGIPFKGRIPVQQLKDKIIKVLTDNIVNKDINAKSIDLTKLVEINIREINRNSVLTGELKQNPKFSSYMEDKTKYNQDYAKFVDKTNQWRQLMNFSQIKLVDIANNQETRDQITQWVKSIDPTNPVISWFESDSKIQYMGHDSIMQIRDNTSEPYYWITRWKDMIIDSIKAERPVLESTFNLHNTPINLLVSASEMIPYWLTYNSNMKLYVIQINFFGSKLAVNTVDCDEFLTGAYNNFAYREPSGKKWSRCYRTVLANGEPVCMPF